LDEYRHRGQNGVGQLSSSNQPQPGSIDDFPPLGRGGPGEIGGDRRMNILQNNAGSNYGGNPGFPPGNSESLIIGKFLT
jgi:CCR4-NOT transcription complex subunit 2